MKTRFITSQIFYNLAFILLIFIAPLLGEEEQITLSKIKEKYSLITSICSRIKIDKEVFMSIIYTERTLNYNWEDETLDNLIASSGYNSSVGFCQIKIKTAYWVGKQTRDSSSVFFPGKDYCNLLPQIKEREKLINCLNNDSLNILYAALYIKIISLRWKSYNIDISLKPDILGTLYSTGVFYRNGSERKPRVNPVSNSFGMLAKKNYENIFKDFLKNHLRNKKRRL